MLPLGTKPSSKGDELDLVLFAGERLFLPLLSPPPPYPSARMLIRCFIGLDIEPEGLSRYGSELR